MTQPIRLRTILLPAAATLALLLCLRYVIAHAAAEDAGAEVAAQLDAAAGPSDPAPVIAGPDPAPPPAIATPAPVSAPAGAAALPSGMAHGLAWASVLLSLVAILRGVLARLEPTPGEPAPAGWRARAIPILSSVIALLGALADVLAGAPWHALVPVALTAVAMIWTAIDPPRGSARRPPAAATLVTLVAVVALAGCCRQQTEAREPGAPTVVDRALEVGKAAALGFLCSSADPPVLADSRAAVTVWTLLRSALCGDAPAPAGPVVAGELDVGAAPAVP
jgi:hypothetical protein